MQTKLNPDNTEQVDVTFRFSTIDEDIENMSTIILPSLKIADPQDPTKDYYYTVDSDQLRRYKYWDDNFKKAEGKELSWNQLLGKDPIDGPDGYYVTLGSGGSCVCEVKDKVIIKQESYSSSESYIWSHIEKYYNEIEKERQAAIYLAKQKRIQRIKEAQAKIKKEKQGETTGTEITNESFITPGSMRIEGAEIS